MPKMIIKRSFRPFDGPMYHPHSEGREVAERHLAIALSMGATLVEEKGEKKAPLAEVENRGSQTAEKEPPAKKAEAAKKPAVKKPNPNLDKWNADKKRAKELGYTGEVNKVDIEAFLAVHDKATGEEPVAFNPPWQETPSSPSTFDTF